MSSPGYPVRASRNPGAPPSSRSGPCPPPCGWQAAAGIRDAAGVAAMPHGMSRPALRRGWEGGRMHTDDPVLDLMDRFTAALNSHDLDAVAALITDDIVFESTSPPPDGTHYEGRDAVCQIWGQMLATTHLARFSA